MLATPSSPAHEPTTTAQPSLSVGLLYACSGDLAANEHPLLQATQLAIEEINASGGILGHRIAPVLGDSASSQAGFLAQVHSLLAESGTTTLFGGSSAETRQACIPLLQEHDALLWHPLSNEGLESSRQVFYGGACPNQELLPALQWLLKHLGDRLYLVGTDTPRSRLLHRLIRGELAPANGLSGQILGEWCVAPENHNFSPCWQAIAQQSPSVIITTLEASHRLEFFRQHSILQHYKALRQQAILQEQQPGQGSTFSTQHKAGVVEPPPIFSFDLTATDLQQLGDMATGHYTAAGYFPSLPHSANQDFRHNVQTRYGSAATICDAACTAYSQVYLWKQAVEAAQSFEPSQVRAAAYGQTWEGPSGLLRIDTNHYTHRPCHIARITPEATFKLLGGLPSVAPQPWLGIETSPHGSLITELLAQAKQQEQTYQQLKDKQNTQEELLEVLKIEIVEREKSEQKVQLLLNIRQQVEQATTVQEALNGAIQAMSQATGWPYGELWLLNDDHLQRSSIWYLDESRLSPVEIEKFQQQHQDHSPSIQAIRERFLDRIWQTEKSLWTSALYSERVVGIPIFETKAGGDWTDMMENHSEAIANPSHPNRTNPKQSTARINAPENTKQIIGILLFWLPQVRSCDRPLVSMISEVAAQLSSIMQQKKAEAELRQKNKALAIALEQLQDTQAELNQSEKMAALGHFAAGIAHELNTPIGAINASVDAVTQFIAEELEQIAISLLSRPLEQQEVLGVLIHHALEDQRYFSNRERRQLQRSLLPQLEAANIPQCKPMAEMLVNLKAHGEIDRLLPLLDDAEVNLFLEQLNRIVELCQSTQDISLAIERASKVTIALKTYTQTDHAKQGLEETDIVGDLERVLDLYQNRLGNGITIVRQFPPQPAKLLCHLDRLNQVWTHLIYNAIQAIEDARSQGSSTEPVLTLEVHCSPPVLTVRITDSGVGIPAELKREIFNPFFTTRPAGEGSGLGLNIAQKIVTDHGGSISVESVPERTTFTVRLPLDGCASET